MHFYSFHESKIITVFRFSLITFFYFTFVMLYLRCFADFFFFFAPFFQIEVKSETTDRKRGSLIAELSYVVARLHRDMYMSAYSETPLVHKVDVSTRDVDGPKHMVC